jgi:hypothetical protein
VGGAVAWALSVLAAGGAAARAQTEPRLPEHITPATKESIDKGLAYLARTQGRDGAWRNRGSFGRYPVAMSALAGMALLMDGNTTTQGRYAPNVDRVTRFLVAAALPNGLIARGDEEARTMYGHGFSMLFLGQLLGMTEDPQRQREIAEVLNRGVALTGQAQSRIGGWIYTPDGGTDEGSVTITQVQALRSCRTAGVSVPKKVIDDAMNYLKISANSDGGIRYRAQSPGPSRPPLTAAAVMCWFNAGEYDNPLAKKALQYSKQHIRAGANSSGHYYYEHLYFAQAMYLSGPDDWNAYFPKMRDALTRSQNDDGSWDDLMVGEVYGTSIALIILQLPFEQVPIMQR